MLNTQTKILLLVFAGLVLVYLLYNSRSGVTSAEHFTSGESASATSAAVPQNMAEAINPKPEMMHAAPSADTVSMDSSQVPVPREDMIKYFPQRDYSPPESDWLEQKFNSRNKPASGQYKRSSYSGAKRGALGPSDWASYFDHNNNVIGSSQTGDNDKFLPVDETNGGFAVFKSKGRATCGSNQNCEPEDLFDVDKYLPQEVNSDWFEVQPEPISVKNRHLINITKPIGINTIGTSLKNATYDLRSAPACPKYVTSPWLNSSIEPDINLKPLM